MGFLRPPVCRLPRFFLCALRALAMFFCTCPGVSFLVRLLVANCLRGVFPGSPVFFLAVVLERAISLKYNEFLGSAFGLGWEAINKDRSFPLILAGPTVIGSTLLFLVGDNCGVLHTLVFGVELNSDQITEPESLQPVWSIAGATIKNFCHTNVNYLANCPIIHT